MKKQTAFEELWMNPCDTFIAFDVHYFPPNKTKNRTKTTASVKVLCHKHVLKTKYFEGGATTLGLQTSVVRWVAREKERILNALVEFYNQ